jgi:hypothetical protein
MPTTITKGATTVVALFVLGWNTPRTARTVEHDVIGKPIPDFTLRPSGPRGGTLTYFFDQLTAAQACETLHADAPAQVTVADPGIPAGVLTYVVTGDVTLSAADEAGAVWTVAVGFRAAA